MSNDQKIRATSSEGDESFIAWLGRWALVTSLLIVVFDLAVFRQYPFPEALDGIRAVFYTVYGAALVLASIAFAFLGYRVVTTRYQGRTRDIYLLFLPPVLLVTSLVWMVLLSRAG